MTGAELVLRTAVSGGVEVCFANPGTTEMDLVVGMDSVGGMRPVLALFEGVATGMADGYGRMADRPALTLLHLGVGLGNGIANLHNARRAGSPVVNLVGDHPVSHLPYDAPLTSDIAAMAGTVSDWVGWPKSAADAGNAVAEALGAAQGPRGRIATVIAPSDVMGAACEAAVPEVALPSPTPVDGETVDAAARALHSGEASALLLSGKALRRDGLIAAHRVALATGAKVMSECFPGRMDRGAGLPVAERIPYFPEMVQERLEGLRHLILAGARRPVSFFKYPNLPHEPVPEGCEVLDLVPAGGDPAAALEALAEALDAPQTGIPVQEATRPVAPEGELDHKAVGKSLGALLPEGAVVADESATSGGPAYFLTQGCPPHSTLYLTGGAIGMGLPLAAGAAVACPDRPVIALQGDGGGMYTPQALWTQAREGLNVTNVIFSNRSYKVLAMEAHRAGIEELGPATRNLTDLTHPELDWVFLARGLGVPAVRPQSAEEFHLALENALAEPGPHLIEAVV